MKLIQKCMVAGYFLILTAVTFAQKKALYELPSGPDGPGAFGAYYTHLSYDPVWDKPWRVADHPDVVVRFDDGGHKFVFWRGTSYIPCWVTDNRIWYTNEFVERRGIHCENTEGCVEPMSDKQCRYSHVRVIESSDARVVIHWRYSPIDVSYEHAFTDELTGWSDWVDEYYTIYPDASGVRAITVHSSGLQKWTEFQEGILVNQPGTLPDDNVELGAVSVANMKGEHHTYYWDKDGGPPFDENPPRANILTINLKSERRPFALVPPPPYDYDMITAYRGHGRNSHFNWWDHWPVSQDASDGRGARSAERPSHSSLCHIALQKDPPIDCWGSPGYENIIQNGILEWTLTQWGAMNIDFVDPVDLYDSLLLSFDYADLWTSDLTFMLFDTRGNIAASIDLSEYEDELVTGDEQLRSFRKNIYLADYKGEGDLSRVREAMIELNGSDKKQSLSLDNLRIGTYMLDFDLPDGSTMEEINNNRHAGWEPYEEGKDFRTKLMLHGMTSAKVQDLVPLALSWTNPAEADLKDQAYHYEGYDPAQMAYVLKRTASPLDVLDLTIRASSDSPLVNPAFVIHNWSAGDFELTINGRKLDQGKDYRAGIVPQLNGQVLILWLDMQSEEKISLRLEPLPQVKTLPL